MRKIFRKLKGITVGVTGIIEKNSKILLTKRSKLIDEGNKWCLPGGHVKYFEKVEDGLKREIKEEIKVDIKKSKFLFYYDEIIPKTGVHSTTLVFKIEISGEPKKNIEVSEIKWFNKKEILNLDLAFKHKEMLEKYFKKNNS